MKLWPKNRHFRWVSAVEDHLSGEPRPGGWLVSDRHPLVHLLAFQRPLPSAIVPQYITITKGFHVKRLLHRFGKWYMDDLQNPGGLSSVLSSAMFCVVVFTVMGSYDHKTHTSTALAGSAACAAVAQLAWRIQQLTSSKARQEIYLEAGSMSALAAILSLLSSALHHGSTERLNLYHSLKIGSSRLAWFASIILEAFTLIILMRALWRDAFPSRNAKPTSPSSSDSVVPVALNTKPNEPKEVA